MSTARAPYAPFPSRLQAPPLLLPNAMLVPFIVLSFLTTFAHAVFTTLPVGATFKQCSTVTLAWTELVCPIFDVRLRFF